MYDDAWRRFVFLSCRVKHTVSLFAASPTCLIRGLWGLQLLKQNALYAATASETVASRLQLGTGAARWQNRRLTLRFVFRRAARSGPKPPNQTVRPRRAAVRHHAPPQEEPPPQDMDVDSDEDNTISKQKKATEKFMALLKPIKDAALAFDVDVDEALEDYVEACVRYVEKDKAR